MPTKMDLAMLSQAVYVLQDKVNVPEMPPGTGMDFLPTRQWKLEHSWKNKKGFLAGLYVSEGRERVLVFAGTEDLWDLLANDVPIALGVFPPQGVEALQIARQMHGSVYLTGHSLGGALAILAAAQSAYPAVTFNAPGMMTACLQMAGGKLPYLKRFLKLLQDCINNPRVRNYGIAADFVYNVNLQSGGREKSISNSSCTAFEILCRHKIGTVVKQFMFDVEAYRAITL